MIDRRRAGLGRHLDVLREQDGWHPFQNFVLGLLRHGGYRGVRHSNVRSDYGRDAVAVTPDGEPCVVAVSFDCSRAKVLKDAKRCLEDPNREEATVLLFVTADAPAETTWSPWKAEVAELGLELRLFHRESILEVATRDGVWRETCARLGLPGDRPGFRLVCPYDGEVVRQALQARPADWLGRRIELREWAALAGGAGHRLVLGKPGAGKTTTLFHHLESVRPEKVLVVEPDLREGTVQELLDAASGGGVIVFDDAHEKPDELRALLSALRARLREPEPVRGRYAGVRLLLAARAQEWAALRHQLPLTELQDLGLMDAAQVQLGALSPEQCRDLVEACRDEWGLVVEPRLLEHAARAAAERDATPLYVLSMLAPARAREDRTLRDEHLANLPPDVLALWRRYWGRLSPVQQGVLRLVKLFAVTNAPERPELFAQAAQKFGLPAYEVSASLDALEAALWVSREGVLPMCLDVQLEAIDLGSGSLALWDAFVFEVPADLAVKAWLHNGTGTYHAETRLPRSRTAVERAGAAAAALRHFDAVTGLAGDSDRFLRALGLNNLSVCASYLAGLETTREGRGAWLQKAVRAVEEAVLIRRELGVQGDLASALNNVSNRYAALAELEATREGRGAWLQKAVQAVEKAVLIYRDLGVQVDLAGVLNNVSNRYADLAGLETTRESRGGWLQKAVLAVEESVQIYRELSVQGDLAMSLNTLSNHYAHLAGLETTRESRGAWLQKAVQAVEEAVLIYRELGVQGDLAISLGSRSRLLRQRAEDAPDAVERQRDLRASRDDIAEASSLFRAIGDARYFPMSLQDLVKAHVLLANTGEPLDVDAFRALCMEGGSLAAQMEDEGAVALFAAILEQLG